MKGSPSHSRSSSVPPPSNPGGGERTDLADWLTRDLTPKHGVRAQVAPAPSAEPSNLSAAAGGSRAPSAPAVARSLAPSDVWDDAQVGREAPLARPDPVRSDARPALAPSVTVSSATVPCATVPAGWAAVVAASEVPLGNVALATEPPPAAIVPVALEEDDLLVLPGRRRAAAGSGRARLALALLLGLLLVGIGLVVRLGGAPNGEAAAANDTAAPTDNAVLLPPPPEFVAPVPTAEATEPARVPRRGGSTPDEPEGLMDPRDPRFSLGGPSVRRYADVPSPTLSKLAREQRRLAHERDEAIRNAKAAKSKKP